MMRGGVEKEDQVLPLAQERIIGECVRERENAEMMMTSMEQASEW